MEKILKVIKKAYDKYGVSVPLRFLATTKSVVNALKKDSEILRRWRNNYNVVCIGLGIDGSEEVWKMVRKTHNKSSEIAEAIEAIQKAGIIAEGFMVIGFPGESQDSINRSVAISKELSGQGVKIRPYLAKDQVYKGVSDDLSYYADDPELFLNLDYAALATVLTHKDEKLRDIVNIAFYGLVQWLKENNPHGCPTEIIFPAGENIFTDNFYEIFSKDLRKKTGRDR
jgi:hypothetical protein